jgi:hypothetical protein
MRSIFLLPLAALVAVVAGCRSEVSEQRAPSLPQRDLTLVTQTSGVQIASPVETQQPQRVARRARAPRSSLEPELRLAAVPAAPLAAPGAGSVPVLAPEPVAQPASTAPAQANDRELLPGKTITVMPASSGPSAGPDETDELPAVRGHTMVGRGGGRCRGGGRGPGIGIAAAPRPDFR